MTFNERLDLCEPKLQNYLCAFARKHHNLENVIFVPNEEGFQTNAAEVIYIPKDDYLYLLYAMHPNHIILKTLHDLNKVGAQNNLEMQQAINDNKIIIGLEGMNGTFKGISVPTDTMHRIEGSLHHELGHIKHKSATHRTNIHAFSLGVCLFASAKSFAVFKYHVERSPYSNAPILFENFSFLKMLTVVAATCVGSNLYGKYDETRADDSVVNDPAVLYAKQCQHTELHNNLIDKIKNKPSEFTSWTDKFFLSTIPSHYWEKYPSLTGLFFLFDPHPSYHSRAERFKARLEALKKKAAQATSQAS
jgi:hypothetical protein